MRGRRWRGWLRRPADEDYFSARLGELGLNRPLMLVNGACLPKEKLAGLHPALAGRTLVRLIESAACRRRAHR